MSEKALNASDAGYIRRVGNNLCFSFFPEFRADLESQSTPVMPATLTEKPSFRVLSIPELESGDVVLSNQVLREISLLQSFSELYLPSKSWMMAKMLVALMTYLEAYITQKRVLFMVEDNESTIQKIRVEQSLDFDIRLLRIPNLWDPEAHKNILTKDDAILLHAYSYYLRNFAVAKEEYDRTSDKTVEMAKKTAPHLNVTYENWDTTTSNEAIDLAVTQAWARQLNISLWASPLESSFCSPTLLSRIANGETAQIALREIEKSRFGHAKQNNELLRRQLYDYEVPFIFGAILRQSNNWKDLFAVARQIRETREAKAFREWASSVDSDLVAFHRHFQDIRGLASELGEGIDAREKRTIRLEFGSKRLLDLPIPIPVKRSNKDLHLVFLQNLFDMNRSITSVNHEFRRVLYSENSEVMLAEKFREWCRGCEIEVTMNNGESTIRLKRQQPNSESENTQSNQVSDSKATKYETHIYGPVNAPVHTGSGNIEITNGK